MRILVVTLDVYSTVDAYSLTITSSSTVVQDLTTPELASATRVLHESASLCNEYCIFFHIYVGGS